MSLASGVEPDPNTLLPVNVADAFSIRLTPVNENKFPPKAISFSILRLEADIAPLALILPTTSKASPGLAVPIPTLPSDLILTRSEPLVLNSI